MVIAYQSVSPLVFIQPFVEAPRASVAAVPVPVPTLSTPDVSSNSKPPPSVRVTSPSGASLAIASFSPRFDKHPGQPQAASASIVAGPPVAEALKLLWPSRVIPVSRGPDPQKSLENRMLNPLNCRGSVA